LYLAAQARTYGSVRSQLTHVNVQKSTRTTFPRSPSAVSGGELSHAVAPRRDGKLPSIGSREDAGVIGNTSLGIGAGTPAGAPMAAARIAANEIRRTLLM